MKMFVPKKVKYPEEIARLRKMIERRGTLNLDDVELDAMWRLFSKTHYCAGFLTTDDASYVKGFIKYIQNLDVSDLDEILDNAEEN